MNRATPKAEYAHLFLALAVIIMPLHTILSAHLGFSSYIATVISAVVLIAAMAWLRTDELDLDLDAWYLLYIAIALALFNFIFVRFLDYAGLSKILGAIVVPFMLGSIYSRVRSWRLFGKWILRFLVLKVTLLMVFIPEYLVQYPKRPLFHGRAIYLWFGPGLDAAAAMLILRLREGGRWLTNSYFLAGLLLLSLHLAGMNGRSLILSSVLIGVLVILLHRGPKAQISTLWLLYVASLSAFLILLPGRFDHFFASVRTVLDVFGILENAGYVDKSTEFRISALDVILGADASSIFGRPVDASNAPIVRMHFFPAAVFYFTGYVGFALFATLVCGFLARTVRLISSGDLYKKCVGIFSVAVALQMVYLGALLTSPIVFLMLGFILGLPSRQLREHNGMSIKSAGVERRRAGKFLIA